MARPLNWIVVVTRNGLPLTRRALPSLLKQSGLTGPLRVLVVDNSSTDNTLSYLIALAQSEPITILPITPQRGVAHAWNTALGYVFSTGAQHALVVNNDVWVRPDTYAGLLAAGGLFTTAVGEHSGIDVVNRAEPDLGVRARRPHPDFSCFLIRRPVWQMVGPFDENFRIAYGEDCDYHCRMHEAGIRAESVSLPFWHVDGGSGTIKYANEFEREKIVQQAETNREYFKMKWGFAIGSPEYEEFFKRKPERREQASEPAPEFARRG